MMSNRSHKTHGAAGSSAQQIPAVRVAAGDGADSGNPQGRAPALVPVLAGAVLVLWLLGALIDWL